MLGIKTDNLTFVYMLRHRDFGDKLNINCLKNNEVLAELKEEVVFTQSLDVLTKSYIKYSKIPFLVLLPTRTVLTISGS